MNRNEIITLTEQNPDLRSMLFRRGFFAGKAL